MSERASMAAAVLMLSHSAACTPCCELSSRELSSSSAAYAAHGRLEWLMKRNMMVSMKNTLISCSAQLSSLCSAWENIKDDGEKHDGKHKKDMENLLSQLSSLCRA
eukprot:542431-Pelagomonas_calceolata.AAC.6